MKKYNINRKFSLKQYENVDFFVEGLESREEIAKELEQFDQLAKAYRDKLESLKEPFPNGKYKDKEFKPKGNPSIASNWAWREKGK